MKETVQRTLVETLDYLMALARDGVGPKKPGPLSGPCRYAIPRWKWS